MDEKMSAEGEEPSSEDVLSALQALFANDALRISERNRRFLSFVVTQTIEGRSDRIKAYSIGVDVFGRDDSFDPTVDPIVRIEATRLRSALTAYYDGMGGGIASGSRSRAAAMCRHSHGRRGWLRLVAASKASRTRLPTDRPRRW